MPVAVLESGQDVPEESTYFAAQCFDVGRQPAQGILERRCNHRGHPIPKVPGARTLSHNTGSPLTTVHGDPRACRKTVSGLWTCCSPLKLRRICSDQSPPRNQYFL